MEVPHILSKALPLDGPCAVFYRVDTCLDILESILAQQVCEVACYPVLVWGKEVTRLLERTKP
jgi:hypothetical protein